MERRDGATLTMTHVLYRMFNAAGELLYVGQTKNPPNRLRRHKNEKEWWASVATISLQHFSNKFDLNEAEQSAIENEHPFYNKQYNGDQLQLASARKKLGCQCVNARHHELLMLLAVMTDEECEQFVSEARAWK